MPHYKDLSRELKDNISDVLDTPTTSPITSPRESVFFDDRECKITRLIRANSETYSREICPKPLNRSNSEPNIENIRISETVYLTLKQIVAMYELENNIFDEDGTVIENSCDTDEPSFSENN